MFLYILDKHQYYYYHHHQSKRLTGLTGRGRCRQRLDCWMREKSIESASMDDEDGRVYAPNYTILLLHWTTLNAICNNAAAPKSFPIPFPSMQRANERTRNLPNSPHIHLPRPHCSVQTNDCRRPLLLLLAQNICLPCSSAGFVGLVGMGCCKEVKERTPLHAVCSPFPTRVRDREWRQATI